MGKTAFVTRLAELSADLNALHPFREGNGRTLRLYYTLLAQRFGFTIAYDEVEPEKMMQADIQAFRGDFALLTEVYEAIVKQG